MARDFDLLGLCHTIAESSPMPMAAVENANLLLCYANPAFCRLVGKTSQQLIGATLPEATNDDGADGEGPQSLLRRVFKTGNAEIHTGVREEFKNAFYWSYAMWPIVAPNGHIAGAMIQVTETTSHHNQSTAMNQALLVGSVRQHELTEASEFVNAQLRHEIAERKRAAKLLQESEQKYRALFDSIDEGFCIIEKVTEPPGGKLDFRYIEANQAFGEQSGVSNVVGKTIRQMFPEVSEEWYNTYEEVLSTGKPIRFERGLSENGRQLELYAFRITMDGQIRVAVIFKDITHRKRSEAEAQRSAKRFRFLTESMPQKIFTATHIGDIDYFNQLWMDYTGATIEKLKGSGWVRFVHPDSLEETVRLWNHCVQTGEQFHLAHRFRRTDGAYRWHLTLAQSMRTATGAISMWIGSSTDIQEQKETEQELRRAYDDLNQFAFAASHDLQEPLRMITSYSQLLIKEYGANLQGDASMFVEFITKGVKQMQELLNDLLSFSQIGSKSGESHELVDLNVVVETVRRNLGMAIEDSGAVISITELPSVLGHNARFVQLFQNLIGNGIKYHGAQPLRIDVSVQQKGQEWCFAVADNGMGIEPQYFQTIFGVFKRLHGKAIPGTGIGLAICQRVVERCGGRIWVESQVGSGATFYFTLPV